jgi:hypothetical protein
MPEVLMFETKPHRQEAAAATRPPSFVPRRSGKVLTAIASSLLLLLVLAPPAAPAPGAAPPQVQAPTLLIEAPESLEHVADRIRNYDTRHLTRTMAAIGLTEPGPPIRVLLVPEDTDLARQTPDWVAGFARGGEGLIVLFPRRSPSYPDDTLEDVLYHEVAHVLIDRAAGGWPVPRWFHEGLAMAVETTWGLGDRTRLTLAVVVGGRMRMSDVDTLFGIGRVASTRAYAISGAFVRDLLEEYGAGVAGRILGFIAGGETFETAFLRATGEPLEAAEARFWQRQLLWTNWLPTLTSSLVLWMLVTLLALLAVLARRRRRAERRRRWEEEEEMLYGEQPEEDEH